MLGAMPHGTVDAMPHGMWLWPFILSLGMIITAALPPKDGKLKCTGFLRMQVWLMSGNRAHATRAKEWDLHELRDSHIDEHICTFNHPHAHAICPG